MSNTPHPWIRTLTPEERIKYLFDTPQHELTFKNFEFTANRFGRPLVKFNFTHNKTGEVFVSCYPPDRRD